MKTKLISAILTALMALAPFVAAVDLGDYPRFLFEDNNLNAYVVVGAAAAPADVVGAVDLAARLAGESYEEVSTGGVVSVSGGKTEDMKLGVSLADSSAFGTTLNKNKLPGLMDSTVSINNVISGVSYKDNYDVHDEVQFVSGIDVETGLTAASPDKRFKSETFIEVAKGSVKYYYVFDNPLKLGNYISNASDTYPVEIEFLGRTLTITGATASSMTIQSGDEYALNVGDSVTVGGKTLTLQNVGSGGSVLVSVDGVSGSISSGGQKTINGLNIKNKEAFYSTEKADRSATLVAGEDVSETVTDGDAYCVGASNKRQCKNDEVWVWHLANLNTNNPTIGIKYNKQLDEYQEVIKMGQEFALPHDYVKIRLDSYVETDYKRYTVEADEIVDLYKGGVSYQTTARTLHVFGAGTSKDSIETATGSYDTDDLYFYFNSTTSEVEVFYKDTSDNKIKYVDKNGTSDKTVAYLTYQDTRLPLKLSWNGASGTLTLDATVGSDIIIYFEKSPNNDFRYLGDTEGDTSYANDLKYGTRDISGWDEDTRGQTGIVILNPKAHLAGDSFEFDVPGDEGDFKVNVVVLGPSGSASSGSSGTLKKVVPITNAVAKLDTEIRTPTGKHLVLVGGPGVNRLTAQAMGLNYPTYGSSGLLPFGEGQGYIALKQGVIESGKYAVIVAGWEAQDTRNAASVLQQFSTFASKLQGQMAVKVTSVSASGITPA